MFSLSVIRQIEKDKMSMIIRKRIQEEKKMKLHRQNCRVVHGDTIHEHQINFLVSPKKKKRDAGDSYWDPVTHAIDAVALKAGFKTKMELNKKKDVTPVIINQNKKFNENVKSINTFEREEVKFGELYKKNIDKIFDRLDNKTQKLTFEKLEFTNMNKTVNLLKNSNSLEKTRSR
jgi:hypothetical protein